MPGLARGAFSLGVANSIPPVDERAQRLELDLDALQDAALGAARRSCSRTPSPRAPGWRSGCGSACGCRPRRSSARARSSAPCRPRRRGSSTGELTRTPFGRSARRTRRRPGHAERDRRVVEADELALQRLALARAAPGSPGPLSTVFRPVTLLQADLRPHDPELRAFARDRRRRAVQPRLDQRLLAVLGELDAGHLADLHAAVVDRRLADAQPARVGEADGDLGAERAHVLPDQPAGDRERDHRHHPHQAEQAPAPDARLGQLCRWSSALPDEFRIESRGGEHGEHHHRGEGDQARAREGSWPGARA